MEPINKRVTKILGKQGGLPTEPGVYIDDSASSAEDLDKDIIAFAEEYGFQLTPADRDELLDTESEDYYQILTEIADSAVEWLNDHNQDETVYWLVEDNSLFLGKLEDEG